MSMKNLKMKAVLLAAALVYPALAWSAAADLADERTALFTGSSFSVLVPSDGSLKAAYDDLLAIVRPYENTRMSPKELGALASKTENAMHAMGYTGAVIRIEKAAGGRPLALSFTWDPERMKPVQVDRAAVIRELQTAMNSQWEQESEKEKTALPDFVQSSAQSLQSMSEAEDQKEWMLSTAQSYVEGAANTALNSGISALVDGANAQITMGYDREERGMTLSGKLLIPIVSDPSYTLFTQTGITEGDNDRTLFHLGLGQRFYPEAVDFENAGTYMFGMNAVYDYDLDRYHQRMSLGGEFGYETLFMYGNLYRRLTGWRTSPDFDSGLVEERLANGWDLGARYALPVYLPLALTGSYAQWYGDRVSPWGDTDPDELMKDPHIWSIGLEWTPVPALGFSLKQEIEERGDTNTEIMASFNIPLSNGIEDAFNPEMGGVQNTVAGTRNAFIERDYTMPLEYRSKTGKFIITQCGLDAENNDYCFHIQDGFEEPVAGQGVTVTPSDKCVLMTNGGSYTTDGDGNIHASVESSCVNHTVVDVGAGSSNAQFPIDIGNAWIRYAITPPVMEIESNESGVFTLDGGPDAVGIPVEWRIDEGPGTLEDAAEQTDDSGRATVTYVADEDTVFDYEATVVATVAGKDFPAYVKVTAHALTMSAPEATEEDTYTVTVEGGTPGGEFTAETEGPGTVVVPDTGLKFDENGKAEITIQVQSPAEGEVIIKVTDTETGKMGTDSTALELEIYTPAVDSVKPSYNDDGQTVKANEAFTLTLRDLLPGSEVIYRAVNGVRPLEGDSVRVKVAEDGTAELNYQAITDPNVSGFTPDVDFARDLADVSDNDSLTHWSDAPEVPVHQYALSVSAPASTDSAVYEVSITGGHPGSTVTFAIEGHGTLNQESAVFDAQGEAKVQVTVTQPAEGQITVTASSEGHSASDTTDIALTDYTRSADIDYPSFTPAGGTLQDRTVDFNQPFTIHAKGLMPDTAINVTSDGYAVPTGMSSGILRLTTDSSGECDIPYEAISNPAFKDFTVVFQYAINEADWLDGVQFNGAYESDEIAVWQYDLTVSAPDAADDGKDFVIDVTGGQPGAPVTGELGSGQGTITCDAVFSEGGTAQCTVNPEDTYDGQIDITVKGPNGEEGTAHTDTGLVDYTSVSMDYPSFTPINQGRKDNTVEFNKAFSIPVHGLLPNSTISVKPFNAGAFTVTPVNSKVSANENGDAIIDYEAITSVIDSFKVEFDYYLNLAEQAAGNYGQSFSSDDIDVFAYQPEISAPDNVSGDDHQFTVLVSGGAPGSTPRWEITGDGEFASQDAEFDVNGNADALVNVTAPGVTQIVITVTDSVSGLSDTHTTVLNLNAYGANLIRPVYEKGGIREENTVDIEEQFELTVEGLKPGTMATVTGSGIDPSRGHSADYPVGDDGSITIPYDAISNGTATEFGISVEYVKNASGQKDTYEATVNIHNYLLEISAPAAADNGQPYDIEISGGRPDGTYTVTVDHGEIYCERSRSNGIMTMADSHQYSFNAMGSAFCTVTPEAGWSGNITVTAEGSGDSESAVTSANLMTYRPVIEYTSSSSIDGVQGRYDYNEPFEVMVTGLLDGSEVMIEGLPSGVTVKNSTLTANGGAVTVEFNPVTTVSSFTFNVKYFRDKADQSTGTQSTLSSGSLSLKPYSIKFSTRSQTDLDGTMPSNIYLEGGKEGEEITWSVTGDGSITPATGYFGADGTAAATVTGTGTLSNAVVVTAKSMGQTVQLSMNFVNYGLRFASLPTFTNVNAQTFRNTVDTNEQFEVEVNKARPGTEIVWSSDLATPQQVKTVASPDGTSKMTFNAIKNLDDTAVKVFAEYERNSSVKATATANLRLHQYDMALDVGDGKIDAYSNPGEKILDRPVLTVSGGKPGHKAVMSLTGSATFDGGEKSTTFTFDDKGEADLTLVSEADFGQDVSVSVTPADDSFTNSTCSGTLAYSFDSWPYTPEIDQTSIKDPSISAARTIDVETQYTFAVNNVYPNTEVTWSTSNGSAALAQVTTVADKNGRATVTLNPVTDYALRNFRLTAQVWKNPREQTTLNADVNVKQYNLSISSSKSSIVADESFTVTVSGGRPGSAVTWSRTGDGTITSSTSVFDSNGRATANVKGSAPYNSAIAINALWLNARVTAYVSIKSVLPDSIQLGDFPENDNPAGYYPDSRSAVITWQSTECGLWLGGFNKEGVEVTVRSSSSALFGFMERTFTTIRHSFRSLDGKYSDTYLIGELGLYHRGLPRGTFRFSVSYGGSTQNFTVTIQ